MWILYPGHSCACQSVNPKKGEALTRDETARHLGAHNVVVRGYVKILDAIEDLATGVPVSVQPPKGVGSRGTKYEAEALAAGVRPFIDDIDVDGLLHGALKLSDHARADVVAINVDEARALEGVVGVFTAADIPGEIRVGLIHKDWPVMIPEGGRTSYLGDVLVVVAINKSIAVRATELVHVEYEVHQPKTDPIRVVTDSEDAVWGLEGNVLSTSTYQRGDVDIALENSAHVVTETFQTQRVEHAFLEPESTLAIPTDQGLRLHRGTRDLGRSQRHSPCT